MAPSRLSSIEIRGSIRTISLRSRFIDGALAKSSALKCDAGPVPPENLLIALPVTQ